MRTKYLVFFLIILFVSAACKTFGGPSEDMLEITADPAQVEMVLTQLPNDAEFVPSVEASSDMQDLQSIFSNIQPGEDGSFEVTLTDQQLNLVMQAALEKAMDSPDAPAMNLTNPQVRFAGGYVVFEADVTKPIEGFLVINFLPLIEGENVQFEVISATIGNINVPANMLGVAETTINDTVEQAMRDMPGEVLLQDVLIGEGTMTVVGKITT